MKPDKLIRVKTRPDPAQWDDDEVLTLAEATALFFPQGPLTLSSLRNAVASGALEIARVAGKDLTTPRAIRKLVRPTCRAVKPSLPVSGSEKTMASGSSSIEEDRSAQVAAATILMAQRRRSKLISAQSTPQQSVRPTLAFSR